jgi:hypothetical protein
MMFENRVLRRIFGPKSEGVAGDWKRLHNEELHNLYASPNNIRVIKSRRMRGAGHVTCMRWMRNLHKTLVGTPEGTRPLGSPRRRWKCNIRTDVREVWWADVEWIRLDQERDQWRAVANTVMNRPFYVMRNFLTS